MKQKIMDRIIRTHSTKQDNVSGAIFYQENNLNTISFKIGWGKYLQFWEDYCKQIVESPAQFENIQLYEYSKDDSTLKITFVFNFVDLESSIGEPDIDLILSNISKTIFDTLILDSEEAIACVSTGRILTRFVLDFTFPSIRISRKYFNSVMKKNLCANLNTNGVRKDIDNFIGDWNDIIINMSELSPVYGCKISPDLPRLAFIGLWSSSDLKLGDDITESFSAVKHSLLSSHCPKDIKNIDEDIIDYTPLIMSSYYSQKITQPKIEEPSSRSSYHSEISSSSEMDMIYHLIPLISKARFDNPMYRKQIGRCIFNIFKKDSSGLDFFNTYAKDYQEENKGFWEDYSNDTGVNDYLSIRTIGLFAREDSPDEYDEWHNAWMRESINESLDMVETHIAEVMYRLLWLEYLTVGKNDWYRFNPGGTKLVKSIANVEFHRRFDDMIKLYQREAKNIADNIISSIGKADSGDTKKKESEKSKSINEITKKLGTRQFMRAIESHCFIKFYRERINDFFDTNPNLMAWGNVVTEVHGDNIYTRKGKMEDFITMNSDIEYNRHEYSLSHSDVVDLLYWFKTAFIGEGMVEYVLKIFSSFLYGRNKEKVVYAFCGALGNNSKSMIKKLREGVLGVYNVDFPVSMLTDSNQNRSGPSPEVAQAKGARSADIAEPDGNISFMGSLIKRYSGGDSIFARNCNENGGSFEPMFKMILYCNAVPPVEEADEATMNRITVVPFLSVYCKDAPATEEEQFEQKKFPMDPLFEDKVKKFRKPMLWLMIHYFNKYMTEGLPKPPLVKQYTEKYWEENDPYRLFINENLIKTDEAGDKITATNLYKVFKVWYMTNFNTKKTGIPPVSIVTRHLTAPGMLGVQKNRVWSGWRLHNTNDSGKEKSGFKHNID